ncbi:MAG TPA: class 1 fructose-bisphosphatase [Verrucomicrobiae bacterium]|nr:class 1 fructose-bisphosphatase [Verrucomicrobiae bacterium]
MKTSAALADLTQSLAGRASIGPVVTLEQHILWEERRFPHATGEFSWLLSGLTLATKMIQAKVNRAGLTDILGAHENVNVHGEQQQKLDVFANDALLYCLSARDSIGILASEENEEPIILHHGSPTAKYAVVFDPLDGSSNIDVNVSVGTIFAILRRPESELASATDNWLLQRGANLLAAGYVVYGSSTMFVYSVGNGVHGFTLDPHIGEYVLSHPNMRMPASGKYYSVNEAYRDAFPRAYRTFLERLRIGSTGMRYGTRYIGSLVADFHRTLLKGGVFLYPPTRDHPQGKLRLLYEANPIAFLAEQAGGGASSGSGRVLDVQPQNIHQRTPLVVGSANEMAEFNRCLGGERV